jgi:hypothetical protein
MRPSLTSAAKVQTVPKWCVVLCLALVALLLHNPYLAAPAISGGLNVSHLPSYRATVAASELLRFTPAEGQDVAVPVVLFFSAILQPLQTDRCQPRVNQSQIVPAAQQYWDASLWFRPPPSA